MCPEKDDLDFEGFDEMFGDNVTEKPVAPVASKQVLAPVAKPAAPAVEVPVAKPDKTEESVSGVSNVSFGARVSNIPIPRFKGQKDIKSRIAILSENIQTAKIHYVQGIGSFFCMEGKCCELEGLPRVKYLVPIVQYNTDRNGKIIGEELEVRVLALGSEQYNALVDAVSMSGKDTKDIDIVISCSDEQFQKITFVPDNGVACGWKKFSTAKVTYAYYKEHKDQLYMAVGRKLTEASYLAKKGFITGSENKSPTPTSLGKVTSVEDLLD